MERLAGADGGAPRGFEASRARMGLWASVALAATVVAQVHPGLAVVLGAGGGAAALLVLREGLTTRLLTAAAMAPATLGDDAPAWLLVAAAALVALAGPVHGARRTGGTADLQQHLARSRRRGEGAHVLVLRAPSELAGGLLALFRLTDTVSVRPGPHGEELTAVIDDLSFERSGLERRIRALLPEGAELGWAAFPQDGYALDVLVEAARGQLAAPAGAIELLAGAAREATDGRAPAHAGQAA